MSGCGYCKYCNSLIPLDDIIRAHDDSGSVVWVGCLPCYKKRIELKYNATENK